VPLLSHQVVQGFHVATQGIRRGFKLLLCEPGGIKDLKHQGCILIASWQIVERSYQSVASGKAAGHGRDNAVDYRAINASKQIGKALDSRQSRRNPRSQVYQNGHEASRGGYEKRASDEVPELRRKEERNNATAA
jgi:hypothetical protein